MNSFDELLKALDALNSKLNNEEIFVELTIVGSMAIYLNDFKIERFTRDIDYIGFEPSEKFKELVAIVALENSLSNDWVNSRAATINPLPPNINKGLKIDKSRSNITLKIINRSSLINMKVYAAYMRGVKDLEDLALLKVSPKEINSGINYIKEVILHNHGQKRLDDSLEDLKEFEQVLNEN